ncbi:hypothetical protein [Baekduia soli]|uniref:hypothetical protein n=1 Tax=Baekduia soli TaxID=496014 RepID=UPI001652415B|nr:hypothetical protein [Baekduia soli]
MPRSLGGVASLPRVQGWDPETLARAVDDLVACGALTDDAIGVLCVDPRRRP